MPLGLSDVLFSPCQHAMHNCAVQQVVAMGVGGAYSCFVGQSQLQCDRCYLCHVKYNLSLYVVSIVNKYEC